MDRETNDDEWLMMIVIEVLENAGLSYVIPGGPSKREGYRVMKLSGLAIGITSHAKDVYEYSKRVEAALLKAGLSVARPFSDNNILRVSKDPQ